MANPSPVSRLFGSPITGALLLAGAAAALVATGVLGYGRDKRPFIRDVAYFHTAGACWKAGKSPYELKTFLEAGKTASAVDDAGIAYPPQSSTIFLVLAFFSPEGAKNLWMALTLAAAVVLAWLCSGPFLRGADGADAPMGTRLTVAAIVIGAPFISHPVWNGGSGLVAAALIIGSWAAVERDRWVLGGILLGAATFKPQLALVPIVWLLLERRWKPLAVGAVTAVVLSIPAYLASGLTGAYAEWIAAIRYSAGRKLWDGYWSETGLNRLALAAGLSLPDLLLLAPLATFALWKARARILVQDQLPLLMGITFQFIYLHDGDLGGAAPLVPAFFRHLRGKASGWIAVALMLVMFCPQRFLRRYEVLAFIRIPALLALVVWLLVLSVKAAPRPESPREPQPALR